MEIKFKAKTLKGKEIVGDLEICRAFDGELLYMEIITYPSAERGSKAYRIRRETLRQLCGYDKNGVEVYEGDKLQTRDGRLIKATYKANFKSNYVTNLDD